ncbi:Lectin subunit alpha [Lucilia cuprina]|nr:Lectin subunit alpha [Lucilia cuprina]
MKQQILLLLAFTACSVFAQNPERLFKSSKNNEFFIMPAKKYTWQEALKECESRDMDLLTIETEDKAKEIKELLQKVFSGKPIPRFYRCSTVNGPFTYTNWEQSEPNNYQNQNERCVNIGFHGNDQWNDVNCDRKYGMLYTWQSFEREVESRDMDLLTIETEDKAKEIKELLQKATYTTFLCGPNDLENYREFIWISSTVNGPFTYTNWEQSEPNNYQNQNERCVNIGFHGNDQWNDVNCDRKYGFICQERWETGSLI